MRFVHVRVCRCSIERLVGSRWRCLILDFPGQGFSCVCVLRNKYMLPRRYIEQDGGQHETNCQGLLRSEHRPGAVRTLAHLVSGCPIESCTLVRRDLPSSQVMRPGLVFVADALGVERRCDLERLGKIHPERTTKLQPGIFGVLVRTGVRLSVASVLQQGCCDVKHR